jgi:hypothetical protein
MPVLQYLCTTCRPDLSFATKELARYNSCYNYDAWLLAVPVKARRVATYAIQSAQVGLTLQRDVSRSFSESAEAFVPIALMGQSHLKMLRALA